MSEKKLGSDLNQPGSDQNEAEGRRVLGVHTIHIAGRGFLDGDQKQAFIASSAFKTDTHVIDSLPRDVIVEESGDELS